jgi:membrane fusion protein, heavy metal efflux system
MCHQPSTRLPQSPFILRCAAGLAALVLAAGVACTKAPDPPPTAAPTSTPAGASPSGPIEIAIADDARARAGIELESPIRHAVSSRLRLPGSVAPDAYGQVTVVALAAGRVTAIPVELGTPVSAGQPLATIVSPDVADAQAAYLSHAAAVDADHQRLLRLERLVTIGADSRQTLDDAKALRASHNSELERATSRLKLLGFKNAEIEQLARTGVVSSDYVVRAAAAGVVTRREVNPGQTVASDAPIVQVSRLDRVWVLAGVYEQDASRIRVGMPAHVSLRDQPDRRLETRIAYVDPQVDVATRTAQIRLELANPNHALRFGMLVDVEIRIAGASDALTVPSSAIQSVGDAHVVYVQDARRSDVFLEAPVTVGSSDEERSEIRAGLAATDRVVTRGASFVRAERLRIAPLTAPISGPDRPGGAGDVSTRIRVEVTASGFQPSRVTAPANVALTLVFERTTDDTCAKEIVVPALALRKALPLHQPIEVLFPAGPAREIPFACGMDMAKGTLVVGGR